MLGPLYQSNTDLNRQINIIEVRCVVNKSKADKSAGIYELPYEILKSENVTQILHKMFLLIFDTNKTLFIWRRAIISQNLKDKSPESKVYSSVPNSRLTAYLEDNEPLVDERNRF